MEKQTNKSYYQNHKDKYKNLFKERYEQNKSLILLKRKQYYNDNIDKFKIVYKCECGGKYTYCSKSTHVKCKKHLNYIQSNN